MTRPWMKLPSRTLRRWTRRNGLHSRNQATSPIKKREIGSWRCQQIPEVLIRLRSWGFLPLPWLGQSGYVIETISWKTSADERMIRRPSELGCASFDDGTEAERSRIREAKAERQPVTPKPNTLDIMTWKWPDTGRLGWAGEGCFMRRGHDF